MTRVSLLSNFIFKFLFLAPQKTSGPGNPPFPPLPRQACHSYMFYGSKYQYHAFSVLLAKKVKKFSGLFPSLVTIPKILNYQRGISISGTSSESILFTLSYQSRAIDLYYCWIYCFHVKFKSTCPVFHVPAKRGLPSLLLCSLIWIHFLFTSSELVFFTSLY